MYKELKTLKDMMLKDRKEGKGNMQTYLDMKAEAIRDRKQILPETSVLDYIEWKFNLTEEDLK